MNIVQELTKKGLIRPPQFISDNIHYLTVMGSEAYGVSNRHSDIDIYGFCIPKKEMIFPHLSGEIEGFGRQNKRFKDWQQHHIKNNDKEYDITIYSIVRYFQLCMENNPNMIDSLFTPRTCVMHSTKIGEMVRENRKLFLHKGIKHKLIGYSFSQLSKLKNKNPIGKRKEIIKQFGMDVKFAMHVVRLTLQAEQVLQECDLDLMRNKEILKSVRNGEWSIERIESWFTEKEKYLDELYLKSKLQHSPDEKKIKQLLLNCLEEHYGSLDTVIVRDNKYLEMINKIREIVC